MEAEEPLTLEGEFLLKLSGLDYDAAPGDSKNFRYDLQLVKEDGNVTSLGCINELQMGTTTFSGPVRSEKGFKQVEKNTTTGVITDYGRMDSTKRSDRFYLEEYFKQKPALNAALDSGGTTTTAAELTTFAIANKDFETLGSNYTTALTTFASTSAGILMTTATADQDQAILLPHLDTNQTAWSGTKWGTENEVEWECSIMLAATDNQKVWAGLKLTNDQLVATDANQIFFKFQTDATNSEAFTTFANWHVVHSIADTDYISRLPIAVAANTPYHLKIEIDSDRKATWHKMTCIMQTYRHLYPRLSQCSN